MPAPIKIKLPGFRSMALVPADFDRLNPSELAVFDQAGDDIHITMPAVPEKIIVPNRMDSHVYGDIGPCVQPEDFPDKTLYCIQELLFCVAIFKRKTLYVLGQSEIETEKPLESFRVSRHNSFSKLEPFFGKPLPGQIIA